MKTKLGSNYCHLCLSLRGFSCDYLVFCIQLCDANECGWVATAKKDAIASFTPVCLVYLTSYPVYIIMYTLNLFIYQHHVHKILTSGLQNSNGSHCFPQTARMLAEVGIVVPFGWQIKWFQTLLQRVWRCQLKHCDRTRPKGRTIVDSSEQE